MLCFLFFFFAFKYRYAVCAHTAHCLTFNTFPPTSILFVACIIITHICLYIEILIVVIHIYVHLYFALTEYILYSMDSYSHGAHFFFPVASQRTYLLLRFMAVADSICTPNDKKMAKA